jgi:cytochrome P450
MILITNDSIIAGSDSISSTIEWMVMFLAMYPEIQEKVHHELDQVIGRGRSPALEDQQNLTYLSVVIMEVMRIRSVAFFAVPHECIEDSEVCGVKISKGSTVLINIFKLANDPS